MLWKKQREIEELVFEHLNRVDESLRFFLCSLNSYVQEGDVDKAEEYALETHKTEGQADDVRRRVETQLLTGALMPASRRDILQLVEQRKFPPLIRPVQPPADRCIAVLHHQLQRIVEVDRFFADAMLPKAPVDVLFAAPPAKAGADIKWMQLRDQDKASPHWHTALNQPFRQRLDQFRNRVAPPSVQDQPFNDFGRRPDRMYASAPAIHAGRHV